MAPGGKVEVHRRTVLDRVIRSFFAPQTILVWLNSDGAPVVDKAVSDKLSPPYNWRSDQALDPSAIPHLERLFDLDWSNWWAAQAETAKRLAAEQTDLVACQEKAVVAAREAYAYARRQAELRLRVEVDERHRKQLSEDLSTYASVKRRSSCGQSTPW